MFLISRLWALFELDSKSVYDGIISRCRDAAVICKDSKSLPAGGWPERLSYLSALDPEGSHNACFFFFFFGRTTFHKARDVGGALRPCGIVL